MRKLSERSSRLLALLSMVLLIQFSFSQVSTISCIRRECEALLRLKKSFNDPSHRLASWKGEDCCNWDGVDCNKTTGHVVKIDLRNNNQVHPNYSALYGNSIDSSLLEFKYLNYLDLSGNVFTYSKIPNFLGSMFELRYLNLSGTSFSGKVPPHIGNLTKLVTLDLSINDFYERWKWLNGDVEWISGLSSLEFLDLSWINFSEASNLMRVLSSLPLLSSLRLRSCSLQNAQFSLGFLNSSFLTRIQHLDLSSNYFNDPILKAFQNMPSLRSLNLSNNHFTTIEGGLSYFIGSNCGLEVLDLSENHDLGGDVFGSFKNVSVGCSRYNLQELDLSYTNLRNKIPNWLGMFKHLQSINLLESNIYGPIPTSLGNLSNIQYLDLASNSLSRSIPASFGRLLNLRRLDLAFNRLEGEVNAECFSQLRNLEELDISRNKFSGVITEAHFANLSSLHTLGIASNHVLFDMKSNWVPPFQLNFLYGSSCIGCFGSKFPQWLQTQKTLVVLELFNMSISSVLPTWLTGQNLTTLDLSHNQIVGPFPTSVGEQIPNLKVLFLNNNLIHGCLPPSVCKWKDLEAFDVSNNRLSGTVHGCLLTSNLLFLDLSSNKFYGTFPSRGNLSNIQQLYLRNNHFEGSMPVILKNSRHLKLLDLEGNQFSGNIPTWVGDNLKNLQFLMLRDNWFNGTLPSNLCLLTYLKVFDVAYNQLEGSIPPNLSNFEVMTGKIQNGGNGTCFGLDPYYCGFIVKNIKLYSKSRNRHYIWSDQSWLGFIDLSNNFLVGFIPREITSLKGLMGLNLSHNNLIGTIPTEMGAIESLEVLDLSFNQLFGPIPTSMIKLSYLSVLELSHNNLSGNVPAELPFLTFPRSSFDDNPYLCGVLLDLKCVIEKPFEPPHRIENLDQEEDRWEKWFLNIMIMLGFVTGFSAVVGGLILKRSWRYTYFKFVDEIQYKFVRRRDGA